MDCDGDGSKRVRKRKTTLYAQICKQMEFYFSDANLQKDRFLSARLSQSSDGYIELSLFLTFNRIRAFTTKTRDIASALRKSDFLQLDDDGLRVKRTTAVKKPENTDDRTVYVECLPVSADHEWISRVFSACGDIAYVSIPRYHSTGDPKGFAFVEFETEDAAHKACELLNNPPASLDDRAGKFPKWNKTLAQLQMQIEKNTQESEEKVKSATQPVRDCDSKPGKQNRKHHLAVNNDSAASEKGPDCKRLHLDSSDIPQNVSSSDLADVSNISEKSEADNPSDNLRSEGDGKTEAGDSRKRKRKRRKTDKKVKDEKESVVVVGSSTVTDDKQRRKRKRLSADAIESPVKKTKISSAELTKESSEVKAEKGAVTERRKKTKKRDSELPELRVISKAEWLTLKKEYLCVQKANMTDLKRTLKQCKDQMNKTTQEHPASLSSKSQTTQDVAMVTKLDKTPEFMANVIVKVHGPHLLDRKQLKAMLPADVNVAYIDVQDGISTDGYIRCKDAESAETLIKFEDSDNTFTLITGPEEESYWNKLKADRETKLSATKRGKKRGMQKLVERAERLHSEVVQRKHVVFADE